MHSTYFANRPKISYINLTRKLLDFNRKVKNEKMLVFLSTLKLTKFSLYLPKNLLKKTFQLPWWLMPVIPDTGETEREVHNSRTVWAKSVMMRKLI
jgi:hypothetical protein